jgi:hypothetical protein
MLFKPFMLFDKDPDSGGGGEGAGNSDDKTAKTYTQAELNAMFAERQQRGATAAITDILKKTGIDTVDNLVALTGEAKKLKEGQLSELEKAQAAIKSAEDKAIQAEADKAAALEKATEKLMRAAVLTEATARGFRPEAVNDVWLVADRTKIIEQDGDFAGVKEAVEAVAKSKPFWLGESKKSPGTPPPKGNEKKDTGEGGEKKPLLGMPTARL